jgi:hypothetical protein
VLERVSVASEEDLLAIDMNQIDCEDTDTDQRPSKSHCKAKKLLGSEKELPIIQKPKENQRKKETGQEQEQPSTATNNNISPSNS